MLYVPCHLPNRLEYKVLSCISVHYQLRMTSNWIANTSSRFHSAGRAIWGWVGGGYLGILWMSLVDVAVGDLVTCMSFVLWVCLRETWTVVETFLNTS